MNVLNAEVVEEIGKFVDEIASDPAIKGAVVTSGKDGFSGGCRSLDAWRHGRAIRQNRQNPGRRGGDEILLRKLAPAFADLSQARDLRKTVRRRDQRGLHGRRLRAGARLPLPRRRRPRQGARRPAGDQGRPVSRRRRHAARGAADADAGRLADVAQRRSDQAGGGEKDGPRACRSRRSPRSSPRQGLGASPTQAPRRPGTARLTGCPQAKCSRRPA